MPRAEPTFSAIVLLALLLAACTADRIRTPALAVGQVWQWEDTQWTGSRIRSPAPERYTLQLNADRTAVIVADCNRGRTTYEITATGDFKFGEIALTRAACSPDSESDRFVRDLARTQGFFIDNGQLHLEFSARTGWMQFRPAASAGTPQPAQGTPAPAAAAPVVTPPSAAVPLVAAPPVDPSRSARGMILTRSTSKTPAQVMDAVRAYADGKKWVYMSASSIGPGEAMLMTVCIPEVGAALAPAGPQLSALLRCGTLGAYSAQGRTEIAMLDPRYMPFAYPHPAVERAAAVATPLVTEMLDAVAR